MLIEELDVAVVDALRNLFSYLMRRPPFDHVQASPSVFSLGTRRSANEEVVFELAFQSVLLDMVGKGCWDLSFALLARSLDHSESRAMIFFGTILVCTTSFLKLR